MSGTAKPVRQQARSERTRGHIVEAALGVFAAKGYPETSMEDICLAAGCSKGGLYHHFPTKQAVLAATVERLQALDGLEPPLQAFSAATGIREALAGRLLLDLWTAASRDPALGARVAAASSADAVTLGLLVQACVLRVWEQEAEQAA